MNDESWPETDAHSAAAIRAYMQRCEVRLSTVHRVASALLSGAGLIVLFPALAKDSIARVARALLASGPDAPHRFALAGVGAAALLPVVALWLLLRDLVRFYFTGQHFDVEQGNEFFPRFALSGLRISPTDVSHRTWTDIEAAHHDPNVRAFLLPENRLARQRVDDQIARYHLRVAEGFARATTEEERDEQRRLALLELAAIGTRTLPQQAARLEQVLARHLLNLQTLVLRYAKAVLAMLTTAIAAFAAAAVIDQDPDLTPSSLLWLAAVLGYWAPAIIVAVGAPLKWILLLAKTDGASTRAVRTDPQFNQLENLTVALAVTAWLCSILTTALVVQRSSHLPVGAVVAATSSLVALLVALTRWRRTV